MNFSLSGNEKELKKEADELMKIKGETKGSEILTLAKYIESRYGKEGVKKLEETMAKLGYPLEFSKIKPFHWYPEALNILALLVAQRIFGWKDLFEVGYNALAFSFAFRVLVKFLPLSLFWKEAPKIWRKMVTIGELEIAQLNEKEKYIILRVKNYKFHPQICRYYQGILLRLGEILTKSKKITIEETKCMHRNDPYHEFFFKWE